MSGELASFLSRLALSMSWARRGCGVRGRHHLGSLNNDDILEPLLLTKC